MLWTTTPLYTPGIPYEATFGGTSGATPFVSGAAALILSVNPTLSYAEVKALILDNVDAVAELQGRTVAGGRLNIFRAVNATPQPLMASGVGCSAPSETLTSELIGPLVTEALARWQATGKDTAALSDIDIRIADLGGPSIGMASGSTIWLDTDAAGWGWFVDPTPWEDSEFAMPGDQGEEGRMDLLSVLAHEIGHLLGFDHEQAGVMGDTLAFGTRSTFVSGETTKTITIEVKGDSKKEASEYFFLDLFDLSTNASFTKNRGIGTILNDD
jgi:hypothetical protein